MKNSNNLVSAFFVIAATVFMTGSASTAGVDLSDIVENFGCEAVGGTTTSQPDGSTITACCTETECYICDENGGDCELDKLSGKPTGPRLTKPVLTPGTMIMQPDTNTTVDPRTKAIVRESIIRN